MLAALRNPDPVHQYLATELSAGRIAGPYKQEDVRSVHVSRFDAIPKQGKAEEWRLILDLSFPPGENINDGIDLQPCSLHYPTVDQAIARILQ